MGTPGNAVQTWRFGVFEIDARSGELRRNGASIKLREQSSRILIYLLENAGQMVTREELRRVLWPSDTFVDFDHSLNTAVMKLREVLGDSADAPLYIETVPKRGYRFIAPVSQGPAGPNEFANPTGNSAPPLIHQISDAPTGGLLAPTSEHRSLSRTAVLGLLIAVALTALGFVALIRARSGLGPAAGATAASSKLRILPVTTAAGDAEAPAFSPDGRQIAYVWDGTDRKHQDVYVQLVDGEMPLRLTYSKSGLLGGPAWSPDGRQIAFTRCDGKSDGVYVVPALGGTERRLTDIACYYDSPGPLVWLLDRNAILMNDRCSAAGSFGVVLLSLATGEKQCLASADSANADYAGLALSPNGRTIAFKGVTSANVNEIYTMPLSGGAPKQITFDGNGACINLMWTPDGKSIVFASARGGLSRMWRVEATGGPVEPELVYPNFGSFSNDGRRFVYSEESGGESTAIWRADLATAGGKVLHARRSIYSQYVEDAPQPSPDGTRIVLQSVRTGSAEIWLNSTAGDDPRQLTRLGRFSGTPRWSPDSKWIAFDSRPKSHSQIFVVDAEGRNLHSIAYGDYDNVVPSWSRDGKSIYFVSKRTGSWQVWRHSLENGSEARLTEHGGFDPWESYDRQTVYYSKFDQAGIWSVPVAGGMESLVVADKPQVGYWGHWAITDAGLYLLNAEAQPKPTIVFFNFATRHISPVLSLEKTPPRMQPSLSATRDGRALYYAQYDVQSVVKMIENFR